MSLYIKDADIIAAGAATIQGAVVPIITKRRVTKMTAVNTTGGSVTLKVYNVSASGAADTVSIILSYPLSADETYLCPEAIGAGLNSGGAIYAEGDGISFSYVGVDTAN